MRHHDERRALLPRQLQHELEHALGRGAVQVARGLVGQHAGRLGDQGTGDGHALALAARQLGRAVLHTPGQAHLGQHLLRAARAFLVGQAPDAQRHGHVVQRAELGQQVVELIDKTQVLVAQITLLRRRQLRQVLAMQVHAARGGRVQRAQQVQERALARARGADDGQRLARAHFQVHALQHGHVQAPLGEALGEAPGLQHDLVFEAILASSACWISATSYIIHSEEPRQG